MHERSELESALVSELLAALDTVAVGHHFEVPSAADLCYSMELYLPRLLRDVHREWTRESIDGFFISQATKVSDAMAALVGTCILITDQRLTPFCFEVQVAPTRDRVASYRIRIGEPGGGPLGISGPRYNSKEAANLLDGLVDRLDDVQWVYVVTGPPSSRGS